MLRRRLGVGGVVAILSVAAPALAQSPPAAPGNVHAGEEPPKLDRGGKVVITCTVAAHSRLEDCAVLSEEPLDGGFGQMALRMSKEMRIEGPPGAIGGTVRIPITSKLDRKRGERGDGPTKRKRAPLIVAPSER
jgi:hypothetical protein